MKTNHSEARPPQWAEMLLRLLLKPKDRESVSGDLLEEYRETIVARGAGADLWYVRQVGSFLWRVSWAWGAVLGAALVVRYLFDTIDPPADYRMRATILTYSIFATCVVAGFSSAWRMQSFRAGLLTALGAATIGALLSVLGTAAMLTIWHDPATLAAWRSSGGLDEAFIDVPLKLIPLSVAIGSVGAVLGNGARSLSIGMKGRA